MILLGKTKVIIMMFRFWYYWENTGFKLSYYSEKFRDVQLLIVALLECIGMYWNVLECIGKVNQNDVHLLIVVLLKYIEKIMFTF